MSSGYEVLQPTQLDIEQLLMAKAHLGTKNCNFKMLKYVFKRRSDGVHVISVNKIWEKIVFAARAIVTVKQAADVCAISNGNQGQRAILKFSSHTGATAIAGRFTPGTFTNQIQKAFVEPSILIVTNPQVDHQPIRESSYANIPVIALCDCDSPAKYVDIAIPCNNKGVHSVGLVWWMLAREILRLRGDQARSLTWEIMPDLYFYRDPTEIEEEERNAAAKATAAQQEDQWEESAVAAEPALEAAPQIQPIGTFTAGETAPSTAVAAGDDWGSAPTAGDWGSN
jgi:small subunit ribosomal protein SAe